MKIAVFGAGTMGSGIAQVFAGKGHTVLLYASSTASAQRHKDKLAASLNKRVAKGKMAQEAADDLMSRVLVEEFEAAADADLVIECVAENMAVKKELLGRLDALCKDEAIFASNTSSLSITEMGQGLKHHLIGMHFFNPVPAMKLVEVIAGGNTPAELVDYIKNLSTEIGKTPVVVNEAPGFVVNKILIPNLPARTIFRINTFARYLLSWVSLNSTSMMFSTTSQPMRSPRCRGPMGRLQPSCIAISISSAEATPSCRTQTPSLQ